MRNKDVTDSTAEKCGFKIPESWIVKKCEFTAMIGYPVITNLKATIILGVAIALILVVVWGVPVWKISS